MAILDIRINNCDRNEENILVNKWVFQLRATNWQQNGISFIPIDHGLSFPDIFETFDFELVI